MASAGVLISPVNIAAVSDTEDHDIITFDVKDNTVIPDSKPISTEKRIYHFLTEVNGVPSGFNNLYLF